MRGNRCAQIEVEVVSALYWASRPAPVVRGAEERSQRRASEPSGEPEPGLDRAELALVASRVHAPEGVDGRRPRALAVQSGDPDDRVRHPPFEQTLTGARSLKRPAATTR